MTKIIDRKNNTIHKSQFKADKYFCYYCPNVLKCSEEVFSDYYDGYKVELRWHLFHYRVKDPSIFPGCNIYVKIFEDLQELIDEPYAREKEIVDRESRKHRY